MYRFIEVRTIDGNQCILNTSFIKAIHKDVQICWRPKGESECREYYIIRIAGTQNKDNYEIIAITQNEYNLLKNLLVREK